MRRTPAARSIAPPMPGAVSSSERAQLAMSPFSATWKAPSTHRSRWPPRTSAKLSAGVDQPGVQLRLRRRRPHADDAVLGMEDHLALRRHVIGDQGRYPDAEIDRPAFGDVAGDPRRHRVAAERPPGSFGHAALPQSNRIGGSPAATWTSRWT